MKEGYKKTELGFIPNEWEVKRIGDVFDFSGGLSIPRENLTNEGVNYLHYGDIHKRIENFIDVDIDEKWLPKISQDFGLIKETVKLNDGDVVFADASEDYNGIGKSVAILNKNCKPFVAGLHTIIGKDNSNILDRNFKRFCFLLNSVRLQFRKLATGTSVYGISRENIKKINIAVPSLKEQERIADILSTVDSQIADTDKLIEKTEELKKGLMQRLLTKGVGHTEFKKTEVGEIPVEWEVKMLDEVCNKIIDGNYGARYPKNNEFIRTGIPFFTSTVITSDNLICEEEVKYISKEKHRELEKAHTYKNDVIITNRGARVGAVAIVSEKYDEVNIGPQLTKMTCKEEMLNYKYLYYVLQSELIQKAITSSNSGSAMNFMSLSIIKNIKIPVATLKEQDKIVNILVGVDSEINNYKNKRIKLEELKKGLMQQLLTGKIRVV